VLKHITRDVLHTIKCKLDQKSVTARHNHRKNLLNHQQLSGGLFDFTQLCKYYRVWSRDTRYKCSRSSGQTSRSQGENVAWSPNYCSAL